MNQVRYKKVHYPPNYRYFIERDKKCYCEGNDIDDTLCFTCSAKMMKLTRRLKVKEADVYFSDKLKGKVETI